jgi:uncharacterized membrane protein YpjA
MERVLRWTLETIIRWPLLFWACFVADMVGAVVGGLFWYGPMLWKTPLWALPFVPDCPLAALLGAIGLLAVRAHKRWPLFYGLVAFACMKYGAWTIVFWLRSWSNAGFIDMVSLVLFITHIGLFIEGLLFVPHMLPLSLPGRVLVTGWFALSVYVDYGIGSHMNVRYGAGYHPPLGGYVSVPFAFWLALVLTVVLGIGILVLPRRSAEG